MRNRRVSDGDLDDVALDRLLAPPTQSASVVSDVVLDDVLTRARLEAAHGTPQATQSWRKRWAVPLALGGVVVLAGAGTTAAYQLSVPPFQTLEPGLERTTVGIPVDYVNYRDRPVYCKAFIEFSGLTPTQRQQVNALAADTNWAGYGQRLVDSIPAADRATLDAEAQALSQALGSDLADRTLRAVPGLTADPTRNAAQVTGSSMSCTGVGGQGGAP